MKHLSLSITVVTEKKNKLGLFTLKITSPGNDRCTTLFYLLKMIGKIHHNTLFTSITSVAVGGRATVWYMLKGRPTCAFFTMLKELLHFGKIRLG